MISEEGSHGGQVKKPYLCEKQNRSLLENFFKYSTFRTFFDGTRSYFPFTLIHNYCNTWRSVTQFTEYFNRKPPFAVHSLGCATISAENIQWQNYGTLYSTNTKANVRGLQHFLLRYMIVHSHGAYFTKCNSRLSYYVTGNQQGHIIVLTNHGQDVSMEANTTVILALLILNIFLLRVCIW